MGKVLFSQAFVCSQGGGGPFCLRGGGVVLPSHNAMGRQTPLQVRQNLPPPGKDTMEYGQQAGGTHPTGMHPCFLTVFNWCFIILKVACSPVSFGCRFLFLFYFV